ncbi:septin-5-like [Orbicella faveolata]|uniref:septin-5-like n=1 Tax=Orbicella faveolata TaxID=48498 RepID=UPI0009E52D22|nr:septin-5-like [Orbicella faveolata]
MSSSIRANRGNKAVSEALKEPEPGYVGFANLPNQVHRKSVKKGFEFTLMVVGECYVLLILYVCSNGFLFGPFHAPLLLGVESKEVITW